LGATSKPAAGGEAVRELAEQIRETLQSFRRDKGWIHEQHVQVCRIPAPTFLEQKRAEWMQAQLAGLGWEAQIDRVGNVVAHLRGAAGPFIALTAHLDTVLAPRTPGEISVTPDGRLSGPGVADNGAGLAALLAIAKAYPGCAALRGTARSLLLVANVGEEGEGNLSGMRFLCRQSPFGSRIQTFVVVDGPSTDHITCQALASRRFEVTFTGPGGHSWSDYGVGNPVHALGRAIAMFADARVVCEGSPRLAFNVGVIGGGMSVNSIPASALAKVDIRSESAARIEEAAAALASAVERAREVENERVTAPRGGPGGRIAAKIKEIGSRPGGKLPEDAPLFEALRAGDAQLGIRAQVDCASTDANVPLSMGLPAVSIGAGGQGGGAHTTGEWFHAEGRELGLQRILLTLGLLLGGERNSSGRTG
jgi:tripeptide aminopeptidase